MFSKLIFFWFRENEFRILNESVAEKFHILLRKHLLWFIGLLSLFENHFYRRIGAHFLIWYVRNRDHPLKTSANVHDFWPLPPNVGSFLLLLSVCKFGQFLIPSPQEMLKSCLLKMDGPVILPEILPSQSVLENPRICVSDHLLVAHYFVN